MTAASASLAPTNAALSRVRSSATGSEPAGASVTGGISTTRCSTRPVSVISTTSSRVVASCTTSRCRTADGDSVGYWMTATLRVSWASSRTVRASTSSRSSAPSRKRSMARRSATESGLIADSRSTKKR